MKYLPILLGFLLASGAHAQGTGLPWTWNGEPSGGGVTVNDTTDWFEYTQTGVDTLIVNTTDPISGTYDLLCTVESGKTECGKVRHFYGDAEKNGNPGGSPNCLTSGACPGGKVEDVTIEFSAKFGGNEAAVLQDETGWKLCTIEAFESYATDPSVNSMKYGNPHPWAPYYFNFEVEKNDGSIGGSIQTKTLPTGQLNRTCSGGAANGQLCVSDANCPNSSSPGCSGGVCTCEPRTVFRAFGPSISYQMSMSTVYKFRLRMKLNTINPNGSGNPDGIFQVYVTEVGGRPEQQVLSWSDVHWVAGAGPSLGWNGWNGILCAASGGGGNGASAEFTMQRDDFSIYETTATPPPADGTASVLSTVTRKPAPAPGGVEEARCSALGGNCTCAESLDTASIPIVNGVANPGNTTPTDKQCNGGGFWSTEGYQVIPVAMHDTDPRAVNPPDFVWRNNAWDGGKLRNSLWTGSSKRRCTRYYYFRSANSYTNTSCDGGKYWEQETGTQAKPNWQTGENQGGQCFGSSGGLNNIYSCRSSTEYGSTNCTRGGTGLRPIDCAGEWCVHEMCLSGDWTVSPTTIRLDGYHRRVRDNKMVTFSLTNTSIAVSNITGNVRYLANLHRGGSWNGCPNCTQHSNVYRDISHAMQAEWTSDAGQWIGSAPEMEGCASASPGGC